jgi:hypothetical protein
MKTRESRRLMGADDAPLNQQHVKAASVMYLTDSADGFYAKAANKQAVHVSGEKETLQMRLDKVHARSSGGLPVLTIVHTIASSKAARARHIASYVAFGVLAVAAIVVARDPCGVALFAPYCG